MSKNLTDRSPRLSNEQLDVMAAENRGVGDDFVAGVRSGGLGAGAQLNALAGGVSEAFGADEFAKGRYAAARDLSLRAQDAAPSITSFRDVDGLRSAIKYVAGKAGQSLPASAAAVGAGLATGGNPLAALAAGTAVMAPLEIGDVIQRQQADPVALQHSAGERLKDAAVTGIGSAALQSVVPAIVGGKILGKTATTAAKQSVGKIVGRGLGDVALEGATGGAGELVKQGGEMALNPEKRLDWDAVAENAVGGAAGGLALAGPGTAGELVHSKGQQVKSFVGSAAERAKTAAEGLSGKAQGVADAMGPEGLDLSGKTRSFVGSAKEAVEGLKTKAEGIDLGEAKTTAKDALGSAADSVTNAFSKFKDTTHALVDRVANGEEFAVAKAFVG